ncbi:MAG: hypothetical protein LBE85_11505 [Candidatus Accumulibacter sp.]|jgi:hypothetical protein|nr:hypothetical protein [Accumulibacter sp.]
MGWLFSHQSRPALIAELIKPQESERASAKVIAHALRGKVLWSVVEVTAKVAGEFPNLAPGESRRYIQCDLLKGGSNGWGYMSMDESMHPFYYSCPLSYLDMAPEQSREWREGVRAHHGKPTAPTAPI